MQTAFTTIPLQVHPTTEHRLQAMKRTTLIAAVFAALIVASGFAAAAPGNAPVDVDTGADRIDDHAASNAQHAADNANRSENSTAADERSENSAASDNRNQNGAAADKRSENSAAADTDNGNGQGPAVDLPAQVPDHVSAVHDKISSFLSGDLGSRLGEAISAVTPGDDNTDATDTTNEAQPTDTENADNTAEQSQETDDGQAQSDDTQTDSEQRQSSDEQTADTQPDGDQTASDDTQTSA